MSSQEDAGQAGGFDLFVLESKGRGRPVRFLTDAGCDAVFEMVESGMKRAEIADAVGIPQYRLFDRGIEQRLDADGNPRGTLAHPRLVDLPSRQGAHGGPKMNAVDPTPDEIRAACEAFRASWSEMEAYRRYHGILPDANQRRRWGMTE